jgi:hypothetical protein
MGRSGSPKRIRYVATVPDDLMHVIFSKLDFKDKINAGKVCKQWDQLLKSGTADARHWVVDYNIDSIVSSRAFKQTRKLLPADQTATLIERCAILLTPTFSVYKIKQTLPGPSVTATYVTVWSFFGPR